MSIWRDNLREHERLFKQEPSLTSRQSYVLLFLDEFGPSQAREAGHALHLNVKRCAFCTPDVPCDYAESAGREVLEALRRKGLLRRDRHWVYRRVDASAQTSEIPY